jgi:hypothetical protein
VTGNKEGGVKMKVYLCGPASEGHKRDFDEAKASIEEAVKSNKRMDIEVYSPADLNVDDYEWAESMKESIKLLMTCDTVVILGCIKDGVSRGAVLEQMIAQELEMEVFTYEQFFGIFCAVPF